MIEYLKSSDNFVFRKTFFDETDEFISYPSNSIGFDWPSPRDFHEETSIGLANGDILIFYYARRSHYPLYSFDGDEWTKRSVEISTGDDLFFKNQVLVQIITVQNYDKDR